MTNIARPTHVRYIILTLTVCVAVLLYLDPLLPRLRDAVHQPKA